MSTELIVEPQAYVLARSILGLDFISVEEIATARGLTYTEDQLIELVKKLPDQATLEALRDASMILVAGPPTAMSLIDVRAVHNDFFYRKGPDHDNESWYDNAREKFAKTDKVEAQCWIAFRKGPIEDSLNKTWPDQRALVEGSMMVPNAAEATWALTTYKAVRDIYILNVPCIRTSSVNSDGDRVYVGGFGADGLLVNDCRDDDCSPRLGVATSRKF